MVFLVGMGLAGAFKAWPPALVVLKLASVGYMLWLAWKIAHAAAPGEGRAAARPMTFLQAAAFQWVNPKAWVMAVTAMSTYLPVHAGLSDVLLLTVLFVLINLPCVGVWVGSGMALRRLLRDPKRLRAFNIGICGVHAAGRLVSPCPAGPGR